MPPGDTLDWLIRLRDAQSAPLRRFAVLLGAGADSEDIVRRAFVALARRGNRLIDDTDRLELLHEEVVQRSRKARGGGRLRLPSVLERRQQEILAALAAMPTKLGEVLVVSHGQGIRKDSLQQVLRTSRQRVESRIEEGLEWLRGAVGEPEAVSLPGITPTLSDELANALHSATQLIAVDPRPTPVDDLLPTEAPRGVRLRWVVPAVVTALAAGMWLGNLATPTPPSGVQSAAAVNASPVATLSLQAMARGVPLYYVGRKDGLLYRELRDLPADGDAVASAVAGLLAVAPLDPDYTSAWSAGSLRSVETASNAVTIDLSADAYSAAATSAPDAIGQIVSTVVDVTGNREVVVHFLADGAAPPAVFGNAAGYGLIDEARMANVWIQTPQEGAKLADSTLRITGKVKVDAETPMVTVTNASGEAVASVWAQTATAPGRDGWLSWSVTVQGLLDPGSYVIRATSGDAAVETKAVTIG